MLTGYFMNVRDSTNSFYQGKAIVFFLVLLMSFPVGGYLYGFQEFRSPARIECVASQASAKRLRCYLFRNHSVKRTNYVPLSDWVDYLRYVETKSALCVKHQRLIVEHIPRYKNYAFRKCIDVDEDEMLNRAAAYGCRVSSIKHKINSTHYEKFIV
jgi:hypothetical protein